ncbi:MAG TPA: hypothetical protein VH684_16405 [Xanthobacteraceae bacterium]|jgi:hypothetical protein
MIGTKHILGTAAAIAITATAAFPQGPRQAQQAPPPQQQQQAQQPPVIWENMPRMTLEAEFAGPLKDTTIQRWFDPAADVVCYIYLPFTAQHSAPTPSGYVVYGGNTIGTISCLPGRLVGTAAAPKTAAAPAPARAAKGGTAKGTP